MTRIQDRLVINERYRSTLSPLPSPVFDELESSIKSEGRILQAVLYHLSATGQEVVVDGHHRYMIWQKNASTIEPMKTEEVMELSGASEQEVITWIRRHQRARRNDPTLAEHYETGKEVLGARSNGVTSAEYAAENELTESQARHAAGLASSIDEADEISPGFRDQILGDEKLSVTAAKKAAAAVVDPNPLMVFATIQKTLNSLSRSVQAAVNTFPDVGDPYDFSSGINDLFEKMKNWEDICIRSRNE